MIHVANDARAPRPDPGGGRPTGSAAGMRHPADDAGRGRLAKDFSALLREKAANPSSSASPTGRCLDASGRPSASEEGPAALAGRGPAQRHDGDPPSPASSDAWPGRAEGADDGMLPHMGVDAAITLVPHSAAGAGATIPGQDTAGPPPGAPRTAGTAEPVAAAAMAMSAAAAGASAPPSFGASLGHPFGTPAFAAGAGWSLTVVERGGVEIGLHASREVGANSGVTWSLQVSAPDLNQAVLARSLGRLGERLGERLPGRQLRIGLADEDAAPVAQDAQEARAGDRRESAERR